jgi:nitrite reductase (NADH) large subunit
MKRIVLLGSSVAAAAAIEHIRLQDQESEITLLSFDGHYPYDRNRFVDLIAQQCEYKDVFYKPEEFYAQSKVKVFLDKKVMRINFKKNKIFLEDKEHLGYDILIITDTPDHRLPEIKSTNKTGIFSFQTLKEIDQALYMFPLIEAMAIFAQSSIGISMAEAFVKRASKDIILLVSGNQELPDLSAQESIQVVRGSSLSEILGNGDVKAIKLDSGKVMASQMVLFDQAKEDFRFLGDAVLKMNERIAVNDQFQTNFDNVFALDRACELKDQTGSTDNSIPLAILEEQGKAVASCINGVPIS